MTLISLNNRFRDNLVEVKFDLMGAYPVRSKRFSALALTTNLSKLG